MSPAELRSLAAEVLHRQEVMEKPYAHNPAFEVWMPAKKKEYRETTSEMVKRLCDAVVTAVDTLERRTS